MAPCVQAGIGGVPEATLGLLTNHKDLGYHSELVPDSIIDLVESGVIDNSRKTIHRHKAIAGFALGTQRLFDFIDNNPVFEFHPTAYANDPFVIAQNDNMVALNAAIEVDLTGQVCSDSIGAAPFSGIGGQVDFLRGAARSKGGLPIIALPSTAKHGRGIAHRPPLAAGRRRGDLARRRALRDHRARGGLPAREDRAAARRSADSGGRPRNSATNWWKPP